jgi:hypothetical protein
MSDAENSNGSARVIGRPFPKGVSGNPGGRPKGVLSHAVRRRLEEDPDLVEKVVDQLFALIVGKGRGRASPAVRLGAIEALRDTTEGKPRQQLEVQDQQSPVLLAALEEMAAARREAPPAE